MMCNDSYYGAYRNLKFTDVWDKASDFTAEYAGSALNGALTTANAQVLYYLLYARYGNSTIASSDVTQFKYKVFANIFQYGPSWQKELQIQKELREANLEDLQVGAQMIYNHANNPSTAPSTEPKITDLLPYVDDQRTSGYKTAKIEAYSSLLQLLKEDVTEKFLKHFRKLFLTVVQPEQTLLYATEVDNND